MNRQQLDGYCEYFESLTPAALDRMEHYFSSGARFCDPFNDVRGVPAIRNVFEHMFATTTEPRFEVSERIMEGEVAYLRWVFYFHPRGRGVEPWRIAGVSRVRFADDGRVAEHIDYWDPAEQLYSRLPLVGRLMHWLRRRFSAR